MSGLFEHLDAFDESEKIALRQAIAVANKRFNDRFASFLRHASTETEFNSRLALVESDIDNMVSDVANEYGGDAEKIAAAIKATAASTRVATCTCDGKCEGECSCGGCDSCNCKGKKTANETISADEPCHNCGGHGCEHCTGDPEATKISSKEEEQKSDREGKDDKEPWQEAQQEVQKADERSEVPPWLKKQIADEDQEDGGNLRNKEAAGNFDEHGKNVEFPDLTHGGCKQCGSQMTASGICTNLQCPSFPSPTKFKNNEAGSDLSYIARRVAEFNSQPVVNPVPLEETPGYKAGGDNIDETLENAPSAVGVGHSSHQILSDEHEDSSIYEDSDDEGDLHVIEEVHIDDADEDIIPDWVLKLESLYPEIRDMDELSRAKFFGDTPTGDLLEGIDLKDFLPINSKSSAAHKVEEKDDKFYVTEKGEGEVAGPFDSKEDANARANELNDLENLETEETHSEKESSVTSAMAKALELKEAAKDEWVNEGDTVTEDGETKKVKNIEQEGDEKVVKLDDGSTEDIDDVKIAAKTETGDSTEEREELPTGNEDAHDGPSPKIDKKKWVPNATNPDGNLAPIETEGDKSPHPTHKQDIKQKPDYENEDAWENDNKVWEREELPTATKDEAGFEGTRNIDQPTKAAETFGKGKHDANPVTNISLPDALATKTAAWWDEDSLFREWLAEKGVFLSDDQKALIDSDIVRNLWDQYIQEMPVDESQEIVEDIEPHEEIEEIIEEGDKPGDRVEVIHEEDDSEGIDDLEGPSDDELEDLLKEIQENPDEYV